MAKVSGSYVYNVECRVCGEERKSYDIRMRWDGVYCCPECWEPRNILDFYQTRDDTHKLPFTLPELAVDVGPPIYPGTLTPVCTPLTSSAIPGYAGPGCMIPSKPTL